MKPRNIAFCIIVFAAAAAVFSSRPASAWLPEKYGGTATIRLHSKMSKIDPILATRPDEFTVVFAVFEPLLYRNSGGGVSPLLLEEMPQKSGDGLTYSFRLKDGVTFHDGTTLDTADVLFSFQRLVKSTRSAYSWILDGIKGTTNFRTGRARDIEGFKIIDAQSFEITLVKPNPNFLRLLAFPAACIVSNTNNSFNPPIGSGQFKFTSVKANGTITLSAFDGHRNGRPYIDTAKFVVVKSDDDAVVEFRTSGLTITDTPPDGLRSEDKSGKVSITAGNMKTFFILDINPGSGSGFPPASRSLRLLMVGDSIGSGGGGSILNAGST